MSVVMSSDNNKSCSMCTANLVEPYINCAECVTVPCSLCLNCFAKGLENKTHENCHHYEVVKNDFDLFESQWTALDELKLLDALLDSGHGNWSEIAHQVATKTGHQCEQHYNRNYISDPITPLPAFPMRLPVTEQRPNPITYKTLAVDDPPRPTVGSQLYREMAGYMPARGDFTAEYDDYAESDICKMEFPQDYGSNRADGSSSSSSDSSESEDDDCGFSDTDLKVTVLRIYNRRLSERKRRKQILAKYGLINPRRAASAFKRYAGMLGKVSSDGLIPFMHLVSPVEFDMVLETLRCEQELKKQIKALQEFREAGLTKFQNAKIYMRMKRMREEKAQKRHLLDNVLGQVNHKQVQQSHRLPTSSRFTNLPTHLHRRPPPPLEIADLEAYEKLTDGEKDLCSVVRLVPVAYLEFKALLISEYEKHGKLTLAQARSLIKIDVNKTRKLFDFLVEESYVKK